MTASLPVVARLSETDARGCVSDVALMVFFEAARAVALREFGLPYEEIQARGLNALTVEAQLTNHQWAHVDDPLVVHTWLGQTGRLRFSFAYQVCRAADDTVIASGETVHILIDATDGRPARVPDWFYATLEGLRRNAT